MFGFFAQGSDRVGGDGVNRLADGSEVHLALYKYDSCWYCRQVFDAIDRLGVRVEYRDVRASAEHRRDHVRRTGRGTVPCLYIDDQPMFESRDIAAWLESRFGDAAR